MDSRLRTINFLLLASPQLWKFSLAPASFSPSEPALLHISGSQAAAPLQKPEHKYCGSSLSPQVLAIPKFTLLFPKNALSMSSEYSIFIE